jgi:hypothetical protein
MVFVHHHVFVILKIYRSVVIKMMQQQILHGQDIQAQQLHLQLALQMVIT